MKIKNRKICAIIFQGDTMTYKSLLALVCITVILSACGKDASPTSAPGEYPPPAPILQPSPQSYPLPPTSPSVQYFPYPAPGEATVYDPASGDDQLSRGAVTVELASSVVVIKESQPVQAALLLRGSLPDACHKLRIAAAKPDGQNRIQVEVYALVEAAQVCAAVVTPFEARVSLGSLSPGKYSVWVNSELLKEIGIPASE
jgi:hypothetical protein